MKFQEIKFGDVIIHADNDTNNFFISFKTENDTETAKFLEINRVDLTFRIRSITTTNSSNINTSIKKLFNLVDFIKSLENTTDE